MLASIKSQDKNWHVFLFFTFKNWSKEDSSSIDAFPYAALNLWNLESLRCFSNNASSKIAFFFFTNSFAFFSLSSALKIDLSHLSIRFVALSAKKLAKVVTWLWRRFESCEELDIRPLTAKIKELQSVAWPIFATTSMFAIYLSNIFPCISNDSWFSFNETSTCWITAKTLLLPTKWADTISESLGKMKSMKFPIGSVNMLSLLRAICTKASPLPLNTDVCGVLDTQFLSVR